MHSSIPTNIPDLLFPIFEQVMELNKKFLQACIEGNITEIQNLIAQNADINSQNEFNETALNLVCQNQYIKDIKLCIETAASINYDKTALYDASIRSTAKELKRALIANQEIVNDAQSNDKTSKVINLLIANKANVNLADNHGWSPLHAASISRNVEVINLLIANKANINAAQKDGVTPLHIASLHENTEIINLLIANQAIVDVVDKNGKTPLHIASLYANPNAAKVLIANKANVDVVDKNGLTPLHIASFVGSIEVINLLLNGKANVNAVDKYGFTSLHSTTSNPQLGLADIITTLIANKANVNAVDDMGYTPLHTASFENIEAVRVLIVNQANIDAESYYGITPLHLACMYGNVEIIKTLIEAEVDINKLNKDNKTAYDFANYIGNGNLFDYMINEDKKRIISKLRDKLKISVMEIDKKAKQEKITHLEAMIEKLTKNPDDYECSISHSLMKNPVITSAGNSYEEHFIKRHFSSPSNRDPLTNATLPNLTITPNLSLKRIINSYIDKNTRKCFKALIKAIELEQEEFAKKLINRIKEINNGKFFTCEIVKNQINEITTLTAVSSDPSVSLSLPSGTSESIDKSQGR